MKYIQVFAFVPVYFKGNAAASAQGTSSVLHTVPRLRGLGTGRLVVSQPSGRTGERRGTRNPPDSGARRKAPQGEGDDHTGDDAQVRKQGKFKKEH